MVVLVAGCSNYRAQGLHCPPWSSELALQIMTCEVMPDATSCAGEVQWIHPALPLDLLWDDSLSSGREADQASILQGLLQQALKGPLLPAQQQQVLVQLQSQPKRVFSCGLTPQKLPQLVELNPAIAVEVHRPSFPHAGVRHVKADTLFENLFQVQGLCKRCLFFMGTF